MRVLTLLMLMVAVPAQADPVEIVGATLAQTDGTWTISVTLRHDDTGWEDYADGWRVEDAHGSAIALRVLQHPHVDEQPFTRDLSGVPLSADMTLVYIRARTLTEGWGEDRLAVRVPR